MSPTQRFHLPNALRKTKRTVPESPWSTGGSDNGKLARVVGTETASRYETRSLSTATTAYETRRTGFDHFNEHLPSIALSDASTDAGAPFTLDFGIKHNDLDKKPSSVLLGDRYKANSQGSGSSETKKPRDYGSSSTLHSHYEAQSAPLAISQQTSESSARDRALRKGCPVVVIPNSRSQDHLHVPQSVEPSGSSKQQSENGKKSPASRVDLSALFPPPGSGRKHISKSVQTPPFHSDLQSTLLPNTSPRHTDTRNLASQQDTAAPASVRPIPRRRHLSSVNSSLANIKLNVRRPKAGVKNWFDDVGDDSTDEDIHEEPELQEAFVEGIEAAFGDGSIRPRTAPDAGNRIWSQARTFLNSPAELTLHSNPSFSTCPIPASPADPSHRLTLNIPEIIPSADDPVCFPEDKRSLRHKKSCRFDDADLEKQSVLYLSSSEDDDDDLPAAKCVPRQTPIRDSLAVDSITDAEIEIGTAKAVSKRAMSMQKPPKLKRFKSVLNQSGDSLSSIPVPLRRSSRMQSYLSDGSSISLAGNRPTSSTLSLTPTEGTWPESDRSSIATRRESTRLMNVTRQEEVLLAQMRLKRAEMRQDLSPSRDPWDSSASRASGILHQPRPKNSRTRMNVADHLDHTNRRNSVMSNSTRFRESSSSEDYSQVHGAYSRASATTFQTNRASATTFQTESTRDVEVECSPSPIESHRSPTTPPQGPGQHFGSRRTSSGLHTHFTSSSEEYHNHSRRPTDGSHIIVLDDLDKSPARDTRSQDFIEWPYSGWKSMAGLAVAH